MFLKLNNIFSMGLPDCAFVFWIVTLICFAVECFSKLIIIGRGTSNSGKLFHKKCKIK